MGRLLEAFAEETLRLEPVNEKVIRTPEHQKACDIAGSLVDEMEKRLEGDNREFMEKVLDSIAEEQRLGLRARFLRGYCLGMFMALEMVEMKEKILAENEMEP